MGGFKERGKGGGVLDCWIVLNIDIPRSQPHFCCCFRKQSVIECCWVIFLNVCFTLLRDIKSDKYVCI